MSYRIQFRAEVPDDIEKACRWYEGRQSGLGQVFLSECQSALKRIADNPELYGRVDSDIRSTKLHRFPYVVHYHLTGEHVIVLAVMHGGRDPSNWQSRV